MASDHLSSANADEDSVKKSSGQIQCLGPSLVFSSVS